MVGRGPLRPHGASHSEGASDPSPENSANKIFESCYSMAPGTTARTPLSSQERSGAEKWNDQGTGLREQQTYLSISIGKARHLAKQVFFFPNEYKAVERRS